MLLGPQEGLRVTGSLGARVSRRPGLLRLSWLEKPWASPPPQPEASLRWRPECVPSSATLRSIPQSAPPQLPLCPGAPGPLQCCVHPGMGAKVREESGAACREPGPGTWMTAPGTAEWPRPPELLHRGCAKTPLRTPPPPCSRSLVEQGRLGWADNGGPAGRSRGSSAAKRIKTDGEGEGGDGSEAISWMRERSPGPPPPLPRAPDALRDAREPGGSLWCDCVSPHPPWALGPSWEK